MVIEDKLQALGLRLPDLEEQYRTNLSGARFLSDYAVRRPALSLRHHADEGR